jgi:long-chain fatty acid transport protein
MKLLLLMATVFATQQAMATNGDNMIGFGAISRAMGGTGIANTMGAESVLKNPALLAPTNNFEFIFAGTYFAPNLKAQDNMAGAGFTEKKSSANKFLIPAIAFSSKITENLSFGLGAFGTSGLGADYRDTTATDGLYRMSTSLSTMKFTPALAYNMDNLRLGIGASIMYGSLGMSYDRTGSGAGTTTNIASEGAGSSDDLGTGFDLGIAYKINNFSIGANYQSAILMEYKHQLIDAATDFGAGTIITSDKLEQPAEYGLGVAYNYQALTATADYKIINWAKAEGYNRFGWEDQKVIALGLSYDLSPFTIRAGYNHAKSPLGDTAIKNAVAGARQSINAFNMIGFPAVVEDHYTIGCGYAVTKTFNMDLAFVLVPEVTTTTPGLNMGSGAMPFTVKHSQNAMTVAGKWNF